MSDVDISRARFLRLSDKPVKAAVNIKAPAMRPTPPDFAEVFMRLGYEKTGAYYRASGEKVAEWACEAGLERHKRGNNDEESD